MKLVAMSEDWNTLLIEGVTDDDARILEVLGCEKAETLHGLEKYYEDHGYELWKRGK